MQQIIMTFRAYLLVECSKRLPYATERSKLKAFSEPSFISDQILFEELLTLNITNKIHCLPETKSKVN